MTTGAGVTRTGVGIIGAGAWDLVTAGAGAGAGAAAGVAGAILTMAGAAGVILTTAVAGVGVTTVTETFQEATVTVR